MNNVMFRPVYCIYIYIQRTEVYWLYFISYRLCYGMKSICIQYIGEGVLLEHVYVVRDRNRGNTCEAGSLITMAFMKNVPDTRKGQDLLSQVVYLFSASSNLLVFIYKSIFSLWHYKGFVRQPNFFDNLCYFNCSCKKSAQSDGEITSLCWRVCAFAYIG